MLSLPVANSPHGPGEFDYGSPPIPDARISALNLEHDDLGFAIDALAAANTHDDLMFARLKKRRLQIRDEIAARVAARMRDASDAALSIFPGDTDMGASAPPAMAEAAPQSAAGSFVFGVLAILSVLLVLMVGGSEMVDDLNQTIAQIYLLSLLVAANG